MALKNGKSVCVVGDGNVELFARDGVEAVISSIAFRQSGRLVVFREVRESDVAELVELEKAVWGEAAANADQILSRCQVFPEGGWLAEVDGKAIGYGVCEYIDAIDGDDFTWADVTDDGFIRKSHRPNGSYLYGVNMSVLPEGAMLDVPKNFLSCVTLKELVVKGVKGLFLGSRAPGFHDFHVKHPDVGIEEYVALRDDRGRLRDPMLRFYEELGFKVVRPLPGYFPDPESDDYGVLILKTKHCF